MEGLGLIVKRIQRLIHVQPDNDIFGKLIAQIGDCIWKIFGVKIMLSSLL